MRKALISGITGMDGSHLAELLLNKGYKVYGIARRTSTPILWRIEHILDKIELISADICDLASLIDVFKQVKPDEVYHLAAMSFVKTSWEQPLYTSDCTGLGTTRILEAARNVSPNAKIYNAASSEMFGKVVESPQNENTPFHPRSPYGVAKAYGYYMTRVYRESYNMFCCSGILFNHESERRGIEFVTRKITDSVARIKLGLLDKLKLGNLDAKRDWGYAKDYVRAMYMMLQNDKPVDYVVATGETHTVREFCALAFEHVGLDYRNYTTFDPQFSRPADVEILQGDYTKIRTELGWKPEVSFKELIQIMVDADLNRWEDSNAKAV